MNDKPPRSETGETEQLRFQLETLDRYCRMMGQEIHDGLSQALTASHLQLQAFLGKHPDLADDEQLRRASQYLSKAMAEARLLITRCAPASLDRRGLAEVLRDLIRECREESRTEVRLTIDPPDMRPSEDMSVAAYRIVQEATGNALRHASPSQVTVEVLAEEDLLRIRVTDNGCGFDLSAIPNDRYGVRGIIERAKFAGGRAEVHSTPGEGTVVEAELPLGSMVS